MNLLMSPAQKPRKGQICNSKKSIVVGETVSRTSLFSIRFLVGEEGVEPSHGGFKGPCLTTWLLPNVVLSNEP